MGIFAILGSLLEILKDFLRWQTALTTIKARKLAYDIDELQLERGKELRRKIDAARDDNDLLAVSVLLDAEFAAATFSSDIRTAIHDAAGGPPDPDDQRSVHPANAGDVCAGVGISTGTGTTSRRDNGIKPETGGTTG